MRKINLHPYRLTVWQYSPKKYSEGPQVPCDLPPSCLFTQSSAGESLLLSLPFAFMVSAALRRCRVSKRGAVCLVWSVASPPQPGAVRWCLFTHLIIQEEKTTAGRGAGGADSGPPIRSRTWSAICCTKLCVLLSPQQTPEVEKYVSTFT